MPYRLVTGRFRLSYQGARFVGSKPDGESVWFKPDLPSLLQGISGRDAKFNGGGFAQLRLEGIDALEVHFPRSWHQRQAEAAGARNYLLDTLLGFDVEYAGEAKDGRAATNPFPRSVSWSNPEAGVAGYILTRAIDPYQRPVGFVYTGAPPRADRNGEVRLEAPALNQSANARIAEAGWAYPAYYTHRQNEGGLPVELRDRLIELSRTAFDNGHGVWGVDQSRSNPQIRDYDQLKTLAIWPKLYRRLAAYFDAGNIGLARFDNWIRAEKDRDDQVVLVTRGELGNLHDIYEVRGDRINMLYWPEELMVVPR